MEEHMGRLEIREESEMRWAHELKFRLVSFFSLLRHAFYGLVGNQNAQICITVRAAFGNGKDKSPTSIESNQFAGGDPRFLVIAMRDSLESLTQQVLASGRAPPKMMEALKGFLEQVSGKKTEIVENEDGTKSVKIRNGDGSECECENCRSERIEKGEATEKDRASLN
jgi:hypothetical protein